MEEPRLHEVADRVYAYVQPDGTWCINNAGFIVDPSDETAIIVDACATERRTRAFLDAIRSTTAARPTLLVNTHHHIDHTNGNGVFGGVVVVGHARCRQRMMHPPPPPPDDLITPVEWGDVTARPPTLTFTDRITLWSGDRQVEVAHTGRIAHTDNDVFVWLPSEGVLFTGDLVFGRSMPLAVDGSIPGLLAVFAELERLPVRVVVPGHGDVAGVELIDAQIRYYELVWRLAEAGRSAGMTPLETALEADLGEFSELLDKERLVANLHRAYQELEGGADRELAMVDVFRDMKTYNGDRPLRCVA